MKKLFKDKKVIIAIVVISIIGIGIAISKYNDNVYANNLVLVKTKITNKIPNSKQLAYLKENKLLSEQDELSVVNFKKTRESVDLELLNKTLNELNSFNSALVTKLNENTKARLDGANTYLENISVKADNEKKSKEAISTSLKATTIDSVDLSDAIKSNQTMVENDNSIAKLKITVDDRIAKEKAESQGVASGGTTYSGSTSKSGSGSTSKSGSGSTSKSGSGTTNNDDDWWGCLSEEEMIAGNPNYTPGSCGAF